MDQQITPQSADTLPGVKSATKLTLLQLNAIKLDVRHTILTPDYLEKLSQEKS